MLLVLALILNSAALPSFSSSTPRSSAWDSVRRLYRRICVLRALGKEDEALALERSEYRFVLSQARAEAESIVDEANLLASEAERVEAAALLAEVLAPLLAERLRSAGEPAPTSVALPAPAQFVSSKSPTAPAAPSRPTPAVVPGVADLIEGMLLQQRHRPTPVSSV